MLSNICYFQQETPLTELAPEQACHLLNAGLQRGVGFKAPGSPIFLLRVMQKKETTFGGVSPGLGTPMLTW